MDAKTEIEKLKTKLAKGELFTLSRAACHRIVAYVVYLDRELEQYKSAAAEREKNGADSAPESETSPRG